MRLRAQIPTASLIAAMISLGAAGPVRGAASIRLSGVITGLVTNSDGVPQLGAAITLFNGQEHLAKQVFSDQTGNFSFSGLLPDIYSIRVTLASFVPAVKKGIVVQPGGRNVLNVSLATLFSSIRLVYPAEHPAFMNDEWKWVLRTASTTRPVMRLLPDTSLADTNLPAERPHRPVFSDTRGMLSFSAGDGTPVAGFGTSADMGTAFALATSLLGSNQLQFGGNVGSGAQSGIPSAAFRTTYSRDVGPASPEVSVTMRELFLPGRLGTAIFGPYGEVPMLRNMTASVDDRARLTDTISLQYGTSFDSVSFNDHLSYMSPYGRLVWAPDKDSEVEVGFTSGNARPDLAARPEDSLQREISTLGLFPLVSLRGGHAEVQRGQDLEAGYARTMGSRRFSMSVYHQRIDNLALTISSPDGFLPVGDILPDFYSGTAVFNAGNFSSMGYLATATQQVGEHVSATVVYGSTGALTTDRTQVVNGNPDELRSLLHGGRQQSVTLRLKADSPHTGTHIVASYQIADNQWAVPNPIYATNNLRPMPGLNIYLRQTVPGLSGLPWRTEVTADLRNLLQQGYLPLNTVDGSQLVLMQTPRMLRGGLSFVF